MKRKGDKNIKKYTNESAIDGVQFGLDILGFIPGYGEVADLANAVIYAKRGDWTNAALSLISMIPEIGDVFGKGGRIALFLEKMISKGGRSAKIAEKIMTYAPKVMDIAKKGFKKYKDNKEAVDAAFEAIANSKNENVKQYIAPHVNKLKNGLSFVERANEVVARKRASVPKETQPKEKTSQAPRGSGTPQTRSEVNVNTMSAEDKNIISRAANKLGFKLQPLLQAVARIPLEESRLDDQISKSEMIKVLTETRQEIINENILKAIIHNEIRKNFNS